MEKKIKGIKKKKIMKYKLNLSNKCYFIKKIKYKIFLKILLSLLFLSFFIFSDIDRERFKNISQMYYIGENKHLSHKTIDKYNRYIEMCRKGILADNQTFSLSLFPKITVTMALYYGGKYLYYSLRSIQNQKMKDIEIILINDCSNDDTFQIVKKYIIYERRSKNKIN